MFNFSGIMQWSSLKSVDRCAVKNGGNQKLKGISFMLLHLMIMYNVYHCFKIKLVYIEQNFQF